MQKLNRFLQNISELMTELRFIFLKLRIQTVDLELTLAVLIQNLLRSYLNRKLLKLQMVQ